MRSAGLVTILALMTAACGQKKEEPSAPVAQPDKPNPNAPASQPASAPTATIQPGVPVTKYEGGKLPNIECDHLVPKATRDKYFAGMNAQPGKVGGVGGQESVSCAFLNGREVNLVAAMCTVEWDDSEFVGNMNNAKAGLTNIKTVEGVGKHGFQGDTTTQGMKMVVFRDDDTPCYASVAIKGDNALELAKEIAANLGGR
jgi:hypothetical protein